jgi:NAD-dependent SIR2 family protein deacetylase
MPGEPTCPRPSGVADPVDALAALVAAGNVVVLSGAGLSTESGIPDYRGPTGRARGATPITYQEFVDSDPARRRYWARSHVGWRHIAGARPNAGHRAVAELERRGLVTGVITQNVDGLHLAAGSLDVVELHGRLDRVICLGCRAESSREALDRRLRDANSDWSAAAEMMPDGDAVIDLAAISQFVVVDCETCGGRLKPDVVFFGENVPAERVDRCYAMVDSCQTLLVLGSSLTVMSGYRFVRYAARIGVPVAIVNHGATRGDPHASVLVDAPLGTTLTAIIESLAAARVPAWSNVSA